MARQKYLEYLEIGKKDKALHVLQFEMSKLLSFRKDIISLSRLMMCPSLKDLYIGADWDGSLGSSRMDLLTKLECNYFL
jgi:hypothetical protein